MVDGSEVRVTIKSHEGVSNENEIVFQCAGLEDISTLISRNRLRWFGYVARIISERYPRKLLRRKPGTSPWEAIPRYTLHVVARLCQRRLHGRYSILPENSLDDDLSRSL